MTDGLHSAPCEFAVGLSLEFLDFQLLDALWIDGDVHVVQLQGNQLHVVLTAEQVTQ